MDPVPTAGELKETIRTEIPVELAVLGRLYLIGWISEPAELPDLLREAAMEIERR